MASLIIIIIVIIVAFVAFVAFGSSSNKKIDPIGEQTRITKGTLDSHKQEITYWFTPYVSNLYIKKQQLIYTDDYGDLIESDWEIEKERFIKNKMTLLLDTMINSAIKEFDSTVSLENYKKSFRTDIHRFIKDDIIREISYMIETAVINYEFKSSIKEIDDGYSTIKYNLNDPILFEKSVANNFTTLGWKTRETKKTGDQGADVIAEKDDINIIVQCKLYSRPIGNKAVQEVVAAQNYYKGNMSLVVSNSSYTKSAQRLAESNGVVLLHYSKLSEFLEKL